MDSRAHDGPSDVILLVHGIRDLGAWSQTIDELGRPGVEFVQAQAGHFSAYKFLAPLNMNDDNVVAGVYEEFCALRKKYPIARISVIAHSFGTYIIHKLLETKPDFRLWKLIYCGSVVNEYTNWDRWIAKLGHHPSGDDSTSARPDSKKHVVNDCGTADVWPVWAWACQKRYGAGGVLGFSGVHVENRYHRSLERGTNGQIHGGGHGVFFSPGFATEYWLDFLLNDNKPCPGKGRKAEHLGFVARSLVFHESIRAVLKKLLPVVWCGIPVAFLAVVIWMVGSLLIPDPKASEMSFQEVVKWYVLNEDKDTEKLWNELRTKMWDGKPGSIRFKWRGKVTPISQDKSSATVALQLTDADKNSIKDIPENRRPDVDTFKVYCIFSPADFESLSASEGQTAWVMGDIVNMPADLASRRLHAENCKRSPPPRVTLDGTE